MAAETIQLIGLDDVIARLKALPAALQRTAIRKALFAPAKMLREEVKAAVPVWRGSNKFNRNLRAVPGLWRDSVGVFRDRHPEESGAAEKYYIGERKLRRSYANTARNRRYYRVGKKYTIQGAAYYAKFVEFGTRTTGKGRPGQPAQRIYTKVYEAQKYNSVNRFAAVMSTQTDSVVRKLSRMSAGQL